jgi:hypothetical protein
MGSSIDGLAGVAAVGSSPQRREVASEAVTGAWGRAGPRLYAGRAGKPAAGHRARDQSARGPGAYGYRPKGVRARRKPPLSVSAVIAAALTQYLQTA